VIFQIVMTVLTSCWCAGAIHIYRHPEDFDVLLRWIGRKR